MKNSSTLSFNNLIRFTLFLTATLFFFGFLIRLFLEGNPKTYYDEYLRYDNKMEVYKYEKDEIEALSLGSSYANNIHFDSLGVKGFNFYEPAGDIEETLFKFIRIFPETPKLKYVFLPANPGNLLINHSAYDKGERTSNWIENTPLFYFDYFSYANYLAVNKLSYLLPISDFNKIITSKIKGEARDLIMHNKENGEFGHNCFYVNESEISMEDGIIHGYLRSLVKPECIERFAKSTVALHKQYMNLSLDYEPDVVQINVNRIVKMADMLHSREASLVLFVPPFTRQYYESPEIQSLINENTRIMEELSRHEAIQFYDYHDYFYEELDEGNNNYFYDDDHLALPGAKIFSTALKEEILKKDKELTKQVQGRRGSL